MVVGGRAGGWQSPRPGIWVSGCGQAVVLAVVDALGVTGSAVAPGLAGRAVMQPAGQVRVVRVRDGILVSEVPDRGPVGRLGRDERVDADGDAVVAELGAAVGLRAVLALVGLLIRTPPNRSAQRVMARRLAGQDRTAGRWLGGSTP